MWNDPGSPWHAQTGGPLLCTYTVLYGGGGGGRKETEMMDIILGWGGGGGQEKKNALLSQALALSKKAPIHYFPLRASGRTVGRGHCGKGEGSALRGGGGVGSVSTLKPKMTHTSIKYRYFSILPMTN